MHSQCGVDIRGGGLRHQYTPLQHSRLLWVLKGEKKNQYSTLAATIFHIFYYYYHLSNSGKIDDSFLIVN